MPLSIVPPKPGRTPNYHIRGTYLGIAVNRSAGTPDRRLATKFKKRIEQEIESGIHTPSCGPTASAMEDCDDRRIDLAISTLRRVVGIERVGDVVEVLLDDGLDRLVSDGA